MVLGYNCLRFFVVCKEHDSAEYFLQDTGIFWVFPKFLLCPPYFGSRHAPEHVFM